MGRDRAKGRVERQEVSRRGIAGIPGGEGTELSTCEHGVNCRHIGAIIYAAAPLQHRATTNHDTEVPQIGAYNMVQVPSAMKGLHGVKPDSHIPSHQ